VVVIGSGGEEDKKKKKPEEETEVAKEKEDVLEKWREIPTLKLLNLIYDVTPSEFITMVITEVGMVPPTSVPVILREYAPA
jgi:translation initiation factor 2B subunit (eIF-2B alpha/beta/delta family)